MRPAPSNPTWRRVKTEPDRDVYVRHNVIVVAIDGAVGVSHRRGEVSDQDAARVIVDFGLGGRVLEAAPHGRSRIFLMKGTSVAVPTQLEAQ